MASFRQNYFSFFFVLCTIKKSQKGTNMVANFFTFEITCKVPDELYMDSQTSYYIVSYKVL